ncbi:ABC transporter permease [Acetilactobacillus jinshanensis]|uniref:ABC transporter permease n=1 Tax=Acetilactobacillus jinshanensis TaxID=1720083 RepID=A0A4P6ZLG5_9LACO|nr:ABC transporter permease [Acetilactobacillus jinshanensis]QBP18685.1 ABC transporter permease [Acetilactobacillus jinshanensis]URL61561.1 ABC transporter permease [uncultured bacterium]
MTRLFKQRLSTHLVHMTKYLKYVFNDFFVIALLFFVGGLGLAYSNFLKTLRIGTWWLTPVIGLVILISIQLGRLATLTQDPDYVFLLPKDSAMKGYLKQAIKYSSFNAGIIQIVVWFVLLPLFRIRYQLDWLELISWLIIMLLLKANWLTAEADLEYQDKNRFSSRLVSRLILPVIIIAFGLMLTPWISLILILVWYLIENYIFNHQSSPVDWLRMIRTENHRMHDIYTIFNMFVDVPNFGSAITRRRYLSPLLKLIKRTRKNTYLYLYWHGFVRDKEFSNLYARLVIIGLIILIFIDGTTLSIIMGLVFVYLTVFQIIPFYFHFESNAFIHIYPLNGVNQLKSFQKMLWTLMGTVEFLFVIGGLISGRSIMWDVLLLALMMIEVYGMINVYLPKQVKKYN